MTHSETIRYLESFVNYEKIPAYPYKESLKLERVKDFLASIGNPQDSLSCIHIAGTKGKGSTCVFVAYILRQAGYKVGLYTSPHLSDFRERIRILKPRTKNPEPGTDFEGMISLKELSTLVEKLKPSIEKYNKDSKYGPLSFFEVYTSLAFEYFRKRKADFVILETGLGGRLDATNVVNPLVAAITPISYEHTQKLGNTLIEIAGEKAGIIKPGATSVVITAPQENDVLDVIRKKCKEAGARLYEVGKDIKYRKTKRGFSVEGVFGLYPDLRIRLIGSHQLINAAVAIGIVEALGFYRIKVDIDSIRSGIFSALWPGRCEVILKKPLIVLDGAQNTASGRVLKATIKENFKYKRLILILGISCDKDIKGICKELGGWADEVILTKADNPRAAKPEILAGYFNGKATHITNNVREAKILARRIIGKEDLALVCGSLFVVGEFRNGKI